MENYRKIRPSKWNTRVPTQLGVETFDVAVDFGCGGHPRNPFGAKNLVGVDVFERAPFPTTSSLDYRQVNSSGKLPFENSSVDVLTAFDVLEHIPRQSGNSYHNPFIESMNEIHRALRPGGFFLAVTPCFPSGAAFQDPTHVNIITPVTHMYFSDDSWAKSLGYGFTGEFESVSIGWYDWNKSFLDFSKVGHSTTFNASKYQLLRRIFAEFLFLVRLSTFGWLRKPSHFMWVFRKPLEKNLL